MLARARAASIPRASAGSTSSATRARPAARDCRERGKSKPERGVALRELLLDVAPQRGSLRRALAFGTDRHAACEQIEVAAVVKRTLRGGNRGVARHITPR